MSTPGPQSDDRLSEELVAYLDGELSVGESESVESRLHQDDHARSELQKFDRVWNALDDLPRITVDDTFTRTTIEMAAVEARKELAHETAMLPIRRRNRWLKLAALTTAAGLIGFAAIAALAPNPNRELYTNLPVILELDAYSEVRDIEFLRLLHDQAGDWLLSEWGAEIEKPVSDLAAVTPASYTERREFVTALPASEQTDVASKHRRYESLTPEMRDELNEWHRTVAAAPDAKELQKTLLAYYAWVSQQGEVEQARLRTLSAAERLARVQEIQAETEKRNKWHLSPREASALRSTLDELANNPEMKRLHQAMVKSLPSLDKLPERLSPDRADLLRKLRRMSPQQTMLFVMWLSSGGRAEFMNPAIVAYRDAIEQHLVAAIDPSMLAKLPEEPLGRTRQLAVWLTVASRPQGKPDVATLEEYFFSDKLTEAERQELLAKPLEQMLKELEVLYAREFADDDQFWSELRGGPFGGGRRGGWDRGRDGRGPEGRGDGRRDGERGPGDRGPGGRGDDDRGPRERGPGGPPGERGGPPFGERPPFGEGPPSFGEGPPPPPLRPEG
ncbi:hypothetical protein [Aeoliella sp. SH292]|uniref:anti-sigma factor family protein n=1 Tax=Aeoliella sp. SH292 TaxID=3454464 RepID=UPI003F9776EB